MSYAALANAVRQQALGAQGQQSIPRLATISSYDPNRHAVKVIVQPVDPEVGEQESNWMPLGAIGIGSGWGVAVGPKIGDQVLVVYEGGDFSSGTVVARVFSIAQPAPPVPSGEIWAVHEKGQFLKLTNDGKLTANDAAGSTVVMNGDGTGTVTFAGGLTVNADTTINGTLTVTETITGEAGITITGENPTGAASTITGDFKIVGNIDSTGSITNNGKHVDSTHVHSNGGGGANTGTPVS
ncbi:phage baseplate assembly protein V [Burkholderia gladioli]|uniref:phage baseplate assembly protein V n=1 Tax=Burkholderia gladioli TaxID=28095 RepID=UPI0016410790|nr:phage baseplate assembly protein V [Burkholderia gladioli]